LLCMNGSQNCPDFASVIVEVMRKVDTGLFQAMGGEIRLMIVIVRNEVITLFNWDLRFTF